VILDFQNFQYFLLILHYLQIQLPLDLQPPLDWLQYLHCPKHLRYRHYLQIQLRLDLQPLPDWLQYLHCPKHLRYRDYLGIQLLQLHHKYQELHHIHYCPEIRDYPHFQMRLHYPERQNIRL
jgi:hypothetical protein